MKRELIVGGGLLVGLVIILAVTFLLWPKSSIVPPTITKQTDFVLFYPNDPAISTQKETFKYDPSAKIFSFTASLQGKTIAFTEQSTPSQFSDIPQYYPALIDKLNGYDSFQNAIGQVDLTRPTEVKSETAVMNAKGTLVFARSNGDLSKDSWKLLFNSLSYIQPH
jgi:hypothetical protein